jgi:hypothetical protein
MTQTSTDPGDIREAYERSDEFRDAALASLAEAEWGHLPAFMQEAITTWYAASDGALADVAALVDDARRGPQPGDGDYLGEDGDRA